MCDGEELVEQPFHRLIQEEELLAYRHTGYWASMDTFKDKQQLDDLYSRGEAPWEAWRAAKPDVAPCIDRSTNTMRAQIVKSA
jgi:glucose-1-phosphate cytidylyltransferase